MNKEINIIKKEYKILSELIYDDPIGYIENELYYNFNEDEIKIMMKKIAIENNILFISSLHVEDEFKGKGYGKIAIDNVIGDKKTKCFLICDKSLNEKGKKTNIKFYKKNGFKILYENNSFSLMMKDTTKNKQLIKNQI